MLTEPKYKNIKDLIACYVNLPADDIKLDTEKCGLLSFATACAIIAQHMGRNTIKFKDLTLVLGFIDYIKDLYQNKLNDVTEIPTIFDPPLIVLHIIFFDDVRYKDISSEVYDEYKTVLADPVNKKFSDLVNRAVDEKTFTL